MAVLAGGMEAFEGLKDRGHGRAGGKFFRAIQGEFEPLKEVPAHVVGYIYQQRGRIERFIRG